MKRLNFFAGLLAILLALAPMRTLAQEADLLPVGAKAPAFTLQQLKGQKTTLAALLKKNKVVLVNFWMIH